MVTAILTRVGIISCKYWPEKHCLARFSAIPPIISTMIDHLLLVL